MGNAVTNTGNALSATVGASVTMQDKRHPLLKELLSVESFDGFTDFGLLASRLIAGVSMFIKHGAEKINFGQGTPDFPNFWQQLQAMPDPLHIGQFGSYLCATITAAICTILLILGLCTRLAAAFVVATLLVTWALVLHFAFFAKAIDETRAEMIIAYLAVYIGLLFMGPGKYSLDWRLWGNKGEK